MLASSSIPVAASTRTGVLPLGVISWTGANLLGTAFLLAGLAALALTIDVSVAHYVRNHATPKDLKHFLAVAEVFGWGPTVAVLVYTAVVLDSRGWSVVPPLAIAAAAPGLLADCIKLSIARMRPGAALAGGDIQETFVAWMPLFRESLGQPYGSRLQSFPSGHAAVATGLALGLGTLYPRGRWLFLAFAALAMLQRIDAQKHYVSDLLAGAALAFLCAAGSRAIVRAKPSSSPIFLGTSLVGPQP